MLRLHISGEKRKVGAMRSSIVLLREPPGQMLTTVPVASFTHGRKVAKSSGLMETSLSAGRRASRCRMVAPASAAAMAWVAISSGVQGKASDMVGCGSPP